LKKKSSALGGEEKGHDEETKQKRMMEMKREQVLTNSLLT